MPVDTELQTMLEKMTGGPPLSEVPLHLLRQGSVIPVEPVVAVASVVNRKIPVGERDVPVRIYCPRDASGLPILVYFHGGGFVLGDLESHDSLSRILALAADCIVVSVDYRLAPEHRFPAAVDDALEATRWVHAHASEIGGDASRIAVGGDSAGGNLATVIALRLRDTKGPKLRGQLLIYPVTLARPPFEGSIRANADGYFLRTVDMEWFMDMYLGATGRPEHPDVSPLLVKELRNLPRSFVLTAEFDPLLDQGKAYASRLAEAGNDCTYRHYTGAFHAFFGMPAALSRRAVADAAAWLKTALAG